MNDHPDLGTERNSERATSNFGIENFYSPESLYKLLTADHLSHTYDLQSDWRKIAESGYDPIIDVTGEVGCDLEAKIHPGSAADRLTKVFWFHSDIEIVSDIYKYNNQLVIDELSKNGLKLIFSETYYSLIMKQYGSIAGTEEDYYKNEYQKPNNHGFPLYGYYGGNPYADEEFDEDLVDDPSSLQYITLGLAFLNGKHYDNKNKIRVVLPLELEYELDNLEVFADIQKKYYQNTEKVIRAMYTLENKALPPVKLQFKPEQEESKELFIKCTYCQSKYSTAESMTCPHCGASSPGVVTIPED